MKKKIFTCFLAVLLLVGSFHSPTRNYAIDTFFWLTMSKQQWKLYVAEYRLKSDIRNLESERKSLGEKGYSFKECYANLKKNHALSESDAIRYRDAYQHAVANDEEYIFIDGAQYSIKGMERQVAILLESAQAQEAGIAEYEQLIADASAKQQEIAKQIVSCQIALDRIPVQKEILTVNTTSHSVDTLIAETKNLHHSNQQLLVDPLLTSNEIATRKTENSTYAVSSESLKAFLNGSESPLTASLNTNSR
jgi:hypothetical protein